eukprot:6440737-Amphidinium_carterae.1
METLMNLMLARSRMMFRSCPCTVGSIVQPSLAAECQMLLPKIHSKVARTTQSTCSPRKSFGARVMSLLGHHCGQGPTMPMISGCLWFAELHVYESTADFLAHSLLECVIDQRDM